MMAGLGTKIKEGTAEIRAKIAKVAGKLGDKIMGQLESIVDKYKDIILEALKADGKVIIEEGRTIVIEVINDVVKVIVDGIHALGGGKAAFDSNDFPVTIVYSENSAASEKMKEGKLHFEGVVFSLGVVEF